MVERSFLSWESDNAFEEKMVYALVPVQEMLLKNEPVRMKALLTNIEPHIRYSNVP